VLATDPTNAEALFLMGRTLQEAGNIPAAVDLLGRASNLDVRRAEPAIYLSRALQEAGLAGDAKAAALVALQRVERERRGAATALALDTLAVVLDRVGEHGRAVAMAKRAVALEPRRAAFWRNLGWAELHQNGIPAARAALRKAVALDPNDHQAIAALVDLDLQTEAANFIPQLERLFWATNDPDRRLLLGHALAKSLEDMGQPERAFDWLVRAKAAKRAAVRYDAARDAALFEAAMATVPMETAA
jgi:tetratricopeptide (TPR) repeat protein